MLATLVLSAAGLVGIIEFEGYRDTAYVDGAGVHTVGFGSTAGVKPGEKTTVEKALVRAMQDANRHGAAIKQCIKVPLYQYEFDAYVSMAYNVGQTAFCGSTLVKKLNTYDYAGACAQISRWVKVKSEVSRGLVRRRAVERALCEGKI